MPQISASTSITILATIAVVYFGITAVCTIIIFHVVRKRKFCNLTLIQKSKPRQKNAELEGAKDPNLVSGGRVGAWKHHLAHKFLGNGTSPNGVSASRDSQRPPQLPAKENRQPMRSDRESTPEQPSGVPPQPSRTSKGSFPFQEKKKVRGRTLSTKPLLDRTDSIYSWGLTDSGMDDALTASTTSQPTCFNSGDPLQPVLLSDIGIAGQLNSSTISLPRNPGSSTHTFPRRKPYISGSSTNLDHGKLRRASASSRSSSTSSLNGPKVLFSPIASTSYRARLNTMGKTRTPSDNSLFETVLEMEENFSMMRPRMGPGVMRRATWSQSQHSMPRACLKEVEEEDEHVFETKIKRDLDCNSQEASCA